MKIIDLHWFSNSLLIQTYTSLIKIWQEFVHMIAPRCIYFPWVIVSKSLILKNKINRHWFSNSSETWLTKKRINNFSFFLSDKSCTRENVNKTGQTDRHRHRPSFLHKSSPLKHLSQIKPYIVLGSNHYVGIFYLKQCVRWPRLKTNKIEDRVKIKVLSIILKTVMDWKGLTGQQATMFRMLSSTNCL